MDNRFTRAMAGVVAAASAIASVALAGVPAQAVVGGTPSVSAQFPYLVSVQSSGIFGRVHICGGAILNATTVLTAAHCADGGSISSLLVGYGGENRTSLPHTARLAKITKHPSWNTNTIDGDYALLKLTAPLSFDAHTQPIALATDRAVDGSTAQVAGWGKTAGSNSSLPFRQQFADMQVRSAASCNSAWSDVNPITDKMLCGTNASASACNGDSGGPLVQQQNGRPVLLGVVSWGANGCLADTTVRPTVFADVVSVRSWILSNAGGAPATADATPRAAMPGPGADHGCPRDTVCVYHTDADYQNNQPSEVDDLRLFNTGQVFSIPDGHYAHVVNNTYITKDYSSEGTITLGLLGECVYLPADRQAPDTDETLPPSSDINAIVIATTPGESAPLIVPCPANL